MKIRSIVATALAATVFGGTAQAGVISSNNTPAPKTTGTNWSSMLFGGMASFNGGRALIYSANPASGNSTLLGTISLEGGSPTLNSTSGNSSDSHSPGPDVNQVNGAGPSSTGGGAGTGPAPGGHGGDTGTGTGTGSGATDQEGGPERGGIDNGTHPDNGAPSCGNACPGGDFTLLPPDGGPDDRGPLNSNLPLGLQGDQEAAASAVPEPASMALFGLGLLAAGAMRRRVKRGTR